MQNARRGHDTQGQLKKVRLDSSNEGYSNYMAPMRMQRIARQSNDPKTYTKDVLRPETVTYLTPEWDEFVPFPCSKSHEYSGSSEVNTTDSRIAWKIRFDGFGKSDYGAEHRGVDGKLERCLYGKLERTPEPDDAPPFYQPQGASHTGGTFADVACVCAAAGTVCQCKPATKQEGGEHDTAARKTLKEQMPAEFEPTYSKGCGAMAG